MLVAGPRWDALAIPAAARWSEIPSDRIAVPPDVDGILAVGGGSAIDTGEGRLGGVRPAARLRADDVLGRRVDRFLRRAHARPPPGRRRRGRPARRDRLRPGADARPAAGRERRHGAERARALRRGALPGRARGRPPRRAGRSTSGCRACSRTGSDLEARTRLLEGASDAGQALATHGLYLGHAMAQAVGGRYGLPHGAMNALCLPPAMRFNAPVVPWAMTAVPVERVEELARLAGFERLRDLGVPEEDLDELGAAAAAAAGRAGEPAAGERRRDRRAVPLGLVAGAGRVRAPDSDLAGVRPAAARARCPSQ